MLKRPALTFAIDSVYRMPVRETIRVGIGIQIPRIAGCVFRGYDGWLVLVVAQ